MKKLVKVFALVLAFALLTVSSAFAASTARTLDEIKEKIEKLGLELGMTFSDRLMTALEAESVRVRSEVEETK